LSFALPAAAVTKPAPARADCCINLLRFIIFD
jgi:hypothetical protein